VVWPATDRGRLTRQNTAGMPSDDERDRLVGLWAGEFGDDYVERNLAAGRHRAPFWQDLLGRYPVESALEVGCNVGGNLEHVAAALGASAVAGADVNPRALEIMRERVPGVRTATATADSLPFADGEFDLVFTMGVLIHVAPAALRPAMAEIVRCSSRYVLCGEYHADQPTEVPYRGQVGALFKRDYGALYLEVAPGLELVERGFLPFDETRAWDDITWWLFRQR
jgi:pseudaminic acid biosynthesis-associated methylase